jgi:hypothetical protein
MKETHARCTLLMGVAAAAIQGKIPNFEFKERFDCRRRNDAPYWFYPERRSLITARSEGIRLLEAIAGFSDERIVELVSPFLSLYLNTVSIADVYYRLQPSHALKVLGQDMKGESFSARYSDYLSSHYVNSPIANAGQALTFRYVGMLPAKILKIWFAAAIELHKKKALADGHISMLHASFPRYLIGTIRPMLKENYPKATQGLFHPQVLNEALKLFGYENNYDGISGMFSEQARVATTPIVVAPPVVVPPTPIVVAPAPVVVAPPSTPIVIPPPPVVVAPVPQEQEEPMSEAEALHLDYAQGIVGELTKVIRDQKELTTMSDIYMALSEHTAHHLATNSKEKAEKIHAILAQLLKV